MESQDWHWHGPGTWGLMAFEKGGRQEPGFPKLLKHPVIRKVDWDNGGGGSGNPMSPLPIFCYSYICLSLCSL